jgi:WHG domain-containing protein
VDRTRFSGTGLDSIRQDNGSVRGDRKRADRRRTVGHRNGPTLAELGLVLQKARQAVGSPEAALEELAGAYIGFALEHPALYDAMFSLSTELPFGQPEAPRELHAAFAEFKEAVTPLAGGRDPETLAEIA